MLNFAAIDFETANSERSSVCAVGVVIVRDGEFVDSFYSLIQPEPNYYNYWCSRVHGLCCDDTDDAPIFPEVWKQIEPMIEGLPLVAHNSPATSSSTHCEPRDANSPTSGTTSSTPSPPPVASTSRTTTTPSPTPKPAPGLPGR